MGPTTAEPVAGQGRHVRLAPIMPPDIAELYQLELSDDIGARWRFRGMTPSPEQHAHSLWDSVLATYVVRSLDRAELVGVVTAYKPNLANGSVHLATASTPAYRGSGFALEGVVLFIDSLFRTWDLRKLYVDTLEFNLAQYDSLPRDLFVEEGRMREAEFYDGRFWDRIILTLDRAAWMGHRDRLTAWMTPIAASAGQPSESEARHG